MNTKWLAAGMSLALLCACGSSEEESNNASNNASNNTTGELHPAFAEFDEDNTDIYIEDGAVVIETNGLPNHPSPYWGEGEDLYEEPTELMASKMAGARIPGFDASATLRIPLTPTLADETTATALGSIGIAISGAAIFNDQEGNGPLGGGVVTGLDFTGAHIGPSVYHYHLEPLYLSDDDSSLIGVLTDGFFIYGRKCNSTGSYPTDLDASGGHTSVNQYSTEPEYHYHVINEIFLDDLYILFAGDLQGNVGSFDGVEAGGGMGGGMGGPPGG